LDKTDNESDDTINEILSVVLVDLFYQYEKQVKAILSESIKNGINQYVSTNNIFRDLLTLGFISPVEE
jgi:hypothetical protein